MDMKVSGAGRTPSYVVRKVRDNTAFISNKEHAVLEEEDNHEIKTSTPKKRDAFPELTDLICS